MLSHLLTRLNTSSSENLLLFISYLTRLEMGLGKSNIDYLSRVCVISQLMQGFLMDKIIPLFSVTILDHYCYPGVKIRYLAGYPALIKCNPLDLIGLISIKETRQQALGLLISTPPATINRMSNAQAQLPLQDAHNHVLAIRRQQRHPYNTHHQGGSLGNS